MDNKYGELLVYIWVTFSAAEMNTGCRVQTEKERERERDNLEK